MTSMYTTSSHRKPYGGVDKTDHPTIDIAKLVSYRRAKKALNGKLTESLRIR